MSLSLSLLFTQTPSTHTNLHLKTNVKILSWIWCFAIQNTLSSHKTLVKLRRWHCISYLLSNITQSTEKETQRGWKMCVCQYPAVIAWLFTDGQWRACVEVPPGTQRIWLNLWLSYGLQDALSLDFKRAFSAVLPHCADSALPNTPLYCPRTQSWHSLLSWSPWGSRRVMSLVWGGLSGGHFPNPTVSSFIQSIE